MCVFVRSRDCVLACSVCVRARVFVASSRRVRVRVCVLRACRRHSCKCVIAFVQTCMKEPTHDAVEVLPRATTGHIAHCRACFRSGPQVSDSLSQDCIRAQAQQLLLEHYFSSVADRWLSELGSLTTLLESRYRSSNFSHGALEGIASGVQSLA